MRYRRLSETGDYVFGRGQADFWRDAPEGVAQSVQTRLQLYTGEWFLDTSEGMDWRNKVLGYFTTSLRDPAVQKRVAGTPHLKSILNYSSNTNPNTRMFDVALTIDTDFGQITIAAVVNPIPAAPQIVIPGPPSGLIVG